MVDTSEFIVVTITTFINAVAAVAVETIGCTIVLDNLFVVTSHNTEYLIDLEPVISHH